MITIIILLILAAISINALSTTGLYGKAQEARNATENAQKQEEAILGSYMTELSKLVLKNVDENNTNPGGAMPSGATVVEGDATKGIVIKDSKNNEWVWVEVPKSETKDAVTDSEIETALHEYASLSVGDRVNYGSSWGLYDQWYSKYGMTYDKTNYIRIGITNEDKFEEYKEYYGTLYTDEGITVAESYSSEIKTYYADLTAVLTDKSGCGLTYDEYYAAKSKMLQSIKTYGGFWIARYEAGIKDSDTDITKARESHTDITDSSIEAVSQANMIPYNYVYCSEAQTLAKRMSADTNKTSSLLFGIQWDLTCKFLEERGDWDTTTNTKSFYIKQSSSSWGNYEDILLTTGASDRTKKMNIFDLAGNVSEFTLEMYPNDTYPCTKRGGEYEYHGGYRVTYAGSAKVVTSGYNIGFRSTLY